jgi:hypothetical protein
VMFRRPILLLSAMILSGTSLASVRQIRLDGSTTEKSPEIVITEVSVTDSASWTQAIDIAAREIAIAKNRSSEGGVFESGSLHITTNTDQPVRLEIQRGLVEEIRNTHPELHGPDVAASIDADNGVLLDSEVYYERTKVLEELAGERVKKAKFTFTSIRLTGLFAGVFFVTQSQSGSIPAMAVALTSVAMSWRIMKQNQFVLKWLKNYSFPLIDQVLKIGVGFARKSLNLRQTIGEARLHAVETIPHREVPIPLSLATGTAKIFGLSFGYLLTLHAVKAMMGADQFFVNLTSFPSLNQEAFDRLLEIGIYATKAELSWFLLNSVIYNDQMHKQVEASLDPKTVDQAIMRTAKVITLSLAIAATQSIWSTVAQVSGSAGKPFLDGLFYSGAAGLGSYTTYMVIRDRDRLVQSTKALVTRTGGVAKAALGRCQQWFRGS